MRRLTFGHLGWVVVAHAWAGGDPATLRYARDVRPILAENCFKCHGADEAARQVELRLDTREGATALRGPGRAAIIAGDSARSRMIRRVLHDDPGIRMPPPETNRRLTPGQIEILRRWIDQGAEYEPHWAFVPPREAGPPPARNGFGHGHPIDAFILAELEKKGWAPAPRAPPAVLLRRVCLDLTGLPPTDADAEAFLHDDRPDAYERLVDRLLDSPHYGERWARVWLDIARYADTRGYEKDERRTIWRYRDWVIEAFNRDLPYDRFTLEQLAGDLLPDAAPEQLLATAFHRNTMTNDEGGTDDEEFRTAAVIDRVNTTFQAWMGLTVGCAQCHDHKYDPISQKEYYRLLAFFNQTADSDQADERPTMPLPTREQERRLRDVRATAEGLAATLGDLEPAVRQAQMEWEARAAATQIEPPAHGLVAGFTLDEDPASTNTAGPPPAGAPLEFTDGVIDRAVQLSNQRFIDLGAIADFERSDAFSLGLWILPTGEGVREPIARMDNTQAFRGYDVYIADRKVHVHLIHHWPDNLLRIITREPIDFDRWHHLLVTYDGSSRVAGLKLYVDGLPADVDATHDSLTDSIRTDKPLCLGRRFSELEYQGRIDDVRIYRRALDDQEARRLAQSGVCSVLHTPAVQRAREQADLLRRWFERHEAPAAWKDAQSGLAAARQQEAQLQAQMPNIPILQELPPDQRRQTRIFVRGSFLNPGATVDPDVPAAFPAMPDEAPRNRLGLAQWLVSPDNPLTARVMVNRVWAELFGAGLVETAEDFGTQGSPPAHPELLDWLAMEFMRQGWSVKALCRLIVTSGTYQQASGVREHQLEADPFNRRLARGPRFRLDAETVRDQALAVSGLLSRKLGGPSVMPPQPEGIWQVVYSGDTWMTSAGEDRYRRGLYTFIRRTSPYPSMLTFDAPSRETCTLRRVRTNTPLQALTTLNDPVYVEAAQALARRIVSESRESEVRRRAAWGMRRCLIREPAEAEVEELAALHADALKHYRADVEAAHKMATVPLGPLPEGMEAADLAAWTVVAGVLMNLDEFLVRP